ncbi:sorbitol dehydrogenase-like [Diabrotica virgifera virgifera]|uniref:Sorbitol dehydrogenase n=1 Tax=Diabrotica virgifera virgifera TaxID=50390 RepID=A0ABM5KH51_DIAVI|nr:sorbitol dehydrogenase-like [Diabrotica virgifera virgifera]
MAQDNLTGILVRKNEITLEQRPIPVPGPGQVLLQMEVVGICGSDVHYWLDARCGPFILEAPMVMGHEASGTVVKCGPDVKSLEPGDRVAIEPGVPCRTCEFCKTGRYHICPDIKFCATPPIDGNLARFYVTDEDFCFKLPCNMTLEEGTLMEPLAVGVHACKLGRVTVGSVVFIQGSGPIGLCCVAATRAYGARKILITDVVDYRLELAKKMGATYTLNTSGMDEMQIVNKVREILKEEPHVSIECAGSEMCARLSMHLTRAGGVSILLGMGGLEMTLPFGAALVKEISTIGSFRYNNDYPEAIEMVRSGRAHVRDLVTHHFTLEQTIEAFETHRDKVGNPIKIMIHCNPNWKPGQ